MVLGSRTLETGFDKLQDFLLALEPGDEVTVASAVEVSGLDRGRCDAVLTALFRAGLLQRTCDDAYVRCRLKTPEHTSA